MLDQSLLLNQLVFVFFYYASYSFYVSEIFYGHNYYQYYYVHTECLRFVFFSLSTLIADAYTQAERDDEESNCSYCYDQPVVPLQQNCMIHTDNKFRIEFIQNTCMRAYFHYQVLGWW